MAVISCPECGQTVSTMAEACPHCGVRLVNGVAVNPGEMAQMQGIRFQEQSNAINMQSRIMLDQEKARLESEIFEINNSILADDKLRNSYTGRHAAFMILGILAIAAFFGISNGASFLIGLFVLIPAVIVLAVLDSISVHKAKNLKKRIENNRQVLEQKQKEYQEWYQNYYLMMYNQL